MLRIGLRIRLPPSRRNGARVSHDKPVGMSAAESSAYREACAARRWAEKSLDPEAALGAKSWELVQVSCEKGSLTDSGRKLQDEMKAGGDQRTWSWSHGGMIERLRIRFKDSWGKATLQEQDPEKLIKIVLDNGASFMRPVQLKNVSPDRCLVFSRVPDGLQVRRTPYILGNGEDLCREGDVIYRFKAIGATGQAPLRSGAPRK